MKGEVLNKESMIEMFLLLHRYFLINFPLALDHESNNQDFHLLTPEAVNILQDVNNDDIRLSPGT